MNADRLSGLLEHMRDAGMPLSKGLRRGLEKEGLRVDAKGFISQVDHPRALGCTLTHSSITTDYSEALLELITPVCDSVEEVVQYLDDLHVFVRANLPEGESLWNTSMPCRLSGAESVRIAEYGDSNLGRLKHIYRRGLDLRYGRIMQSIAGIHYNWSLETGFWGAYADYLGDETSTAEFRSKQYFGLIRNFRRHSWLLMYLFGSSPALDRSFLEDQPEFLEALPAASDTWVSRKATSLRMGDLGYQNDAQSGLFVCFNHLPTYVRTLHNATHTPYPPYEQMGTHRDGERVQLNTNVLQIENEYYNNIRPKRVTQSGEKPLDALMNKGVEYIEVRCLDIDPFSPVGVSADQLHFMDLFLLHALFAPSPLLEERECQVVDENFARVVAEGLDPNLKLEDCQSAGESWRNLPEWGLALLDDMQALAELLDRERDEPVYASVLDWARGLLHDPTKTPASRVLAAIEDQGYLAWALALSKSYSKESALDRLSDSKRADYRAQAEASWQAEAALRAADSQGFEDYLSDFLAG